MNLYLILLFSLTTLFLQSYSSPNDRYDACSKNLNCGSLGELSYPFYDESTRPDYCGYPGFKINCSQDIPSITISNQGYYLKDANPADNYTIRITRNDTWRGDCPGSLTNTTMDFSKFNFPSATQNITFFYDCGDRDELPELPLNTTCELGGQESSGYYLTQAMVDEYKNWSLYQRCDYSLFLPVSKAGAEAINSGQKDVRGLIAAFKDGFDLGLIVDNSACDSCIKSDGVCGYDWGSEKFVCHCADADYKIQCGAGSKNKIKIAIGSSIGAVVLLALLGGCFVFARRRRSQRIAQYKTREVSTAPASSTNGLTSSAYATSTTLSQTTASYTSSKSEIGREKTSYFGVHVFEYSELEHATCNFHDSKELGDGGFGTVYYGMLPDGRQVAVKRLYENSFKRVEQFMNEIRILADLQHKNLVALYGCTSRRSRELLLVYEYIPNGTVADHIHGSLAESTFLPWLVRLSIAVETAEALAYLHRNDVIHRDVKTTNILLDNDFHVKVADFGLSRLFPTDMTHVSTAPQGTPGYVDPEYYQCYKLTEKSDVYSFGVVLVELISSKHAVDVTRHRHHVNLANMALDQIQNQELHELVDPRLGFDKDHSVQAMVKMVGELGFRCLQQDRDMRPTMDEVVTTLRAIQMEGLKAQKQEVVDIVVCGDDVGLLTNPTPPLSPELLSSNDVVVYDGKNLK